VNTFCEKFSVIVSVTGDAKIFEIEPKLFVELDELPDDPLEELPDELLDELLDWSRFWISSNWLCTVRWYPSAAESCG
jgi:hypothetical protein